MEIDIEIFYDGHPRKGRVRDVTTTSIEMVFKVVFEDGYENTFFIPLGEKRWSEWKKGNTVLAQTVGAAIEQAINSETGRKQFQSKTARKAYETELDYDGELMQLTFVEVSVHENLKKYLVIFTDGYENIFSQLENDPWMEQDVGSTNLARQVGRAIQFTLRMQS
jgi:hypothetical protein